jgi:hypothetical protein
VTKILPMTERKLASIACEFPFPIPIACAILGISGPIGAAVVHQANCLAGGGNSSCLHKAACNRPGTRQCETFTGALKSAHETIPGSASTSVRVQTSFAHARGVPLPEPSLKIFVRSLLAATMSPSFCDHRTPGIIVLYCNSLSRDGSGVFPPQFRPFGGRVRSSAPPKPHHQFRHLQGLHSPGDMQSTGIDMNTLSSVHLRSFNPIAISTHARYRAYTCPYV